MVMGRKPNVLFVCTGNACRSQMAEAFLRKYAGDRYEVYSAGTHPKAEVHPMAVRVMAEVGLDLTGHRPKNTMQFMGRLSVRHLVIVCHQAERDCPRLFLGAMDRFFWPFDDPAAAEGTEEELLDVFRTVRDQIDQRIQMWLEVTGDEFDERKGYE